MYLELDVYQPCGLDIEGIYLGDCRADLECRFDEGAPVGHCISISLDVDQHCGLDDTGYSIGDCKPDLECKFEEGDPVGLCRKWGM